VSSLSDRAISSIRRGLERFDISLHRRSTRPESTLLGIAGLDIRTVIDVGAAGGSFVRMAAGFFPSARVIAFEPLAEFHPLLRATGIELGLEMELIAAAVGDHVGTTTFVRHVDHPGSSSVLRTSAGGLREYPFMTATDSTEVELTTLDVALAGRAMESELLVKIDVQGFEDRVLQGGLDVLSRTAACVLEVNLGQLYEGQATFDGLNDQLRAAGLRFAGTLDQVIGTSGRVVYLDAVYLRD
jgi:FkbM family methyltransferase